MYTREQIIEELRKDGGRLTKQRLVLLDVIMDQECFNCKEIYHKASRIDKNIGVATVYRMLNKLEEIGAISREYTYRLNCEARHGELSTEENDKKSQ